MRILNINKITIFFFCIFFFSTFPLFSQNIECEKMVFSFGTTSDKILLNDTSPEFEKRDSIRNEKTELPFKIKATLKINNSNNDTIALKTNVKLSALGPTNLRVGLISSTGVFSYIPSWVEHHSSSEFLSDTQSLKFILSNTKSAIVSMEYNVIGSLLFRYQPENEHFYSLQQQYECFYPMDLPINKIKIILPDSIKYFFSSKNDRNGKIKDINISFINKKHYLNYSIKGNRYEIEFYIPNTHACDSLTKQKIYDLQKHVEHFSFYMSNKQHSDVIFINWRDDEHRRAFGESLGSYVVCDLNFGSKDLLHEIIHSFLPIEVEKSSKGEYFIKESIIEWLALYLSETKIKSLNRYHDDSTSLYDIQINNQYSWNKIYLFGPSIIEHIAIQCGREKMAKTIISFLEKNKNQVTKYDSFINYLNMYLPSDLVTELNILVRAA